jgi:hypothetical protein
LTAEDILSTPFNSARLADSSNCNCFAISLTLP